MNKKEILDKIKSLAGLDNDEKAYLVNLVNTTKKYGLVWEDKPEDVEEELRTKLPILKEVKERAIINDTETKNHPNHILIEGDNLHALTSLTFTHEGLIDMIYIDPPYNTGNKDFIYNDSYVDKEDSYRHSKWLSFMNKRLEIAKRLLSDKGVIFISIDDNEVTNLILLCNEVFGENNHIATLPTIMNLKGNQDQFGFAGTHEYSLVYCKNKSLTNLNQLPIEEEELADWEEDELGLFKKGANLKSTGVNAPRNKRPNLFFPIYYNGETTYVTNDDKPIDISHIALYPITDGKEMSWRWSKKKFINEPHNIILSVNGNNISIYKKQRPEIGEIPSKKPKSFFYKPEYSSGNGTAQLKNVLGVKTFNNPKPLDLIMDFITIGLQKKGKILDFFAGSGTTLEAVLKTNNISNKQIEAIIVTNNENQIAEKVTYERNKRVIQGYIDSKGSKIQGLTKNNLRYYQCDFVERKPSLKNKKQLTQLATELLCIKEDCYNEITNQLLKATWHKLFTNGSNNFVYVIYDDFYIEDAVEALTTFITTKNKEAIFKVYVFSNGQYAYADEFEDIAANITLAALPDAIYKAYQNVLPKENKELIPQLDDDLNPETAS